MQKGNIGVTTENIFPVIKKFLYSDHEIFLRELVSNAVDASQKLRTLSSFNQYTGEVGELDVTVTIDKEAGTLTISDRGIGMTAEDIDKYINQIAFSGAEEFLAKYKDAANIIGHFGLGFYSAFMVSKKVEIQSLSYKEGSKGVRWTCDGSPQYEMEEIDKTTRGTDVVLYIDDESKEFLEQTRIDALLKKYCRFLPIPVKTNGNVVNNLEPLWTQKPSELTDEDYIKFYHNLYPGQDDPLFWIHLNVDYPFKLTGVLYFPKIQNNFEINKNRIQLYCNRVYVTDSVEGVVPEFMMLLQGIIDSPDIPLNVSRSYLQADTAVKKISGYITKKVAARLQELYNNNLADFETKWDDIKLFIHYGMLTDEKFCDAAMKFCLVKDTTGKYYNLEQYREAIAPLQTDKSGDVVVLYTTNPVAQSANITDATEQGYNVLVMDGQLETHMVGLLENKMEKTRFVRVDSDVVNNLIPKDDKRQVTLSDVDRNILTQMFSTQVPEVEKSNFVVVFEAMGADAMPVQVTQNEYMRRMKDMAQLQPGMSFYAELPDQYNLVVNTDSELVRNLKDAADHQLAAEIKPLMEIVEQSNKKITELRGDSKDKPDAEAQKQIEEVEKAATESRKKQTELIKTYAAATPQVKQLIDLALLSYGLLKGNQLQDFVKRSLSLLK